MNRAWLTVLLLVALLVVGGVLVTRLQSGEPIILTQGYVPQLDATQALLLAGAVVAIVVSVVGLGVTLAVAMNLGSQQVLALQAQTAQEAKTRVLREPEKARAKPEEKKLIESGMVVKGLAIAANLVALALVAYLTIDRAINPPKEASAEAPAAAPAVAPADLQAAFAALPPGDAAKGKAEFAAQPCASCHSLQPDKVIAGPSLAGTATRAAARKPGYSAELYLYESIVKPGAYVVPNFNDGLMPQDFAQKLNPQQLADIIAFLLTEK